MVKKQSRKDKENLEFKAESEMTTQIVVKFGGVKARVPITILASSEVRLYETPPSSYAEAVRRGNLGYMGSES